MDDALFAALSFPGVVDIYVEIACITHSAAHHGVRLCANDGIVDLFRKVIPTVPPHGRSGRKRFLAATPAHFPNKFGLFSIIRLAIRSEYVVKPRGWFAVE